MFTKYWKYGPQILVEKWQEMYKMWSEVVAICKEFISNTLPDETKQSKICNSAPSHEHL